MTKYYVGHGDLVINASWSPTLKGMAFYTTWAEKKQDIVQYKLLQNLFFFLYWKTINIIGFVSIRDLLYRKYIAKLKKKVFCC